MKYGFELKATLLAMAMSLCLSGVSPAAGPWMDAGDLEETFAGQTIAGRYPNGRAFTETYHHGGRVAYQDDQRKVGGRWLVSASTFCTIYEGDASGGCYGVRRMGENCFEFYFIARTEAKARPPGNLAWTAQAWLSDKSSTCVAGSEV